MREPEVYPVQVQGPKSKDTLVSLFGAEILDIKYYWTLTTELDGIPVVISRTGWTGEVGYEIYLRDPSRGAELWDRIMEAGRPHGIRPIAPVRGPPDRGWHLQLRLRYHDRGHPVPRHGPGAAGGTAGRRLHRQGGPRGDPANRRRPQARRHRDGRRGASVRAVAQVPRVPRRGTGRHRHGPHLVATPRAEHRLRVDADRPRWGRDTTRDRGARRWPLAGTNRGHPIPREKDVPKT